MHAQARRKSNRRQLFGIFAAAVLANLPHALANEPPKTAFDHRVAPILIRNCLGCHNSSQAEGQLDLTTAITALKGGESGEVIVAGKPDESYLVERVRGHEMPPPEKAKPLTIDEVAALAAWIRDGAHWPESRTLSESELSTDRRAGRDWWSWQPVRRPAPSEPPGLSRRFPHDARPRDPIDAFIIARLKQSALAPSPEADRKTLIRRLYFDLVGLPPAPEDMAVHVADPSPDALDRLADRLLASPRYGERWARHWLDVVRFGETNGYEVNTPRDNAWPYRDYVIHALNADTPYDDFIRQQLVGDQLGAGAATGFIVGGPKDQVGNNTPEGQRQQRSDDLDDMLSTAASAFLGLTVNCAKCHNHKFDPIAQADYFRLAAMFAGVNHGDRPVESPDFERRKHEVPAIQRQIDRIAVRLSELDRRIDEIGQPLAVVAAGGDAASASTSQKRPAVNTIKNVDRFSPVKARFVRFTIEAANLYEPCIDEIEIFSTGSIPQNVALAANGAKATASGVYNNGREPIHQLGHVNDGRYGNSRSWISNEVGRGWVRIELAEPVTIDRVVWGRDREEKFRDRLATKYKIEVAAETDQWTTVATSADRHPFDPQKAADSQTPEVLPPEDAVEYRQLKARRVALVAALPKPTIPAYAGSFMSAPPEIRRLHRGDVMQPREMVVPGVIEGVGATVNLKPSASDSQRRRALADWIADPRNPLTARVLVNRLWHYHFGRGLVPTPSNFGFLGGKPTHPELLDWLASELIHRQWSIKAMHRAIVTSATYRQSSADDPKARSFDAGCQLLWRFPPRRLEAEAIRDAMLAAAGTLDLRMGGPGYAVFEPNDNYVRVYIPKKKFGPDQWRRMVYQTKPRMQQDATFGQFDCPEASGVVAARNVSTTALQALNLFNSHFVLQQADEFAKRLSREAPNDLDHQTRRAFEVALGREPTSDEATAAQMLVADHGLAALCRALLNASEFIYMN